jgi:hypothetical protein
MKSQLRGSRFLESAWNLGTTGDRLTRDSKASVPPVLPAVAETLNTLHKLGYR